MRFHNNGGGGAGGKKEGLRCLCVCVLHILTSDKNGGKGKIERGSKASRRRGPPPPALDRQVRQKKFRDVRLSCCYGKRKSRNLEKEKKEGKDQEVFFIRRRTEEEQLSFRTS